VERGAITKSIWISSEGLIHSYSLAKCETGLFSSFRCNARAAFRNGILPEARGKTIQKNDEFHSHKILEYVSSDDFFINRTQEGASN